MEGQRRSFLLTITPKPVPRLAGSSGYGLKEQSLKDRSGDERQTSRKMQIKIKCTRRRARPHLKCSEHMRKIVSALLHISPPRLLRLLLKLCNLRLGDFLRDFLL